MNIDADSEKLIGKLAECGLGQEPALREAQVVWYNHSFSKIF